MKNRRRLAVAGALMAVLLPEMGHATEAMRLSHAECITMALENNRMCKISEFDVRISKAMLEQAKSAYWPSLSAGLAGGIMDEPMVFTYPASSMDVSALASAPPGSVLIDVPPQKVDVMNEEVFMASLNLSYPLYAGGKIKAVNEQAKFGIEAAQQASRRTELEVVRDIDRAYYGAVMTRKLVKISDETLQRMEATLDLTERLYKEGSGLVKKTDYLQNKTVVEMIRTVKFDMKSRQVQADTALVNLVGLTYGSVIEPADTELPRLEEIPSVDELIMMALSSNPQLARVRAGIGAAAAGVAVARSGYKPKVGFFAKYVHIENELETGIMDPQNKDFGMVGIGAEIPIFQGFLTKNRVLESNLQLEKIKMQEDALVQGIALLIEHAYAEYESAAEREISTKDGLDAATENRDLNVRAYQEELVETEDVIQAQFMEAFLETAYQKTLYECIEARAKLSFLVGSETQTAVSAQ